MSDHGQEQAQQGEPTALPRIEDLPLAEHGYDPERVREAFDVFRRHGAKLQAQLRVLQAAGAAQLEPTGHAVRMDALHLIRAAAEFADTLERDARNASAAQLQRAEEETRRRYSDVQEREAAFESYRAESERQRAELLREAEARGVRLLEESRRQAAELTNTARADVEQTLDWARGQADTIVTRAQQGAEQLLAAAGLGADAATRVAETIVRSVEHTNGSAPADIPVAQVDDDEKPPEPSHRPEFPSVVAWAESKP